MPFAITVTITIQKGVWLLVFLAMAQGIMTTTVITVKYNLVLAKSY